MIPIWDSLKKCCRFLRSYYYVPLFLIGILIGWFLFRKRKGPNPIKQTLAELEVIKAGHQVREMEAVMGAEIAKAEVKRRYREKLADLNDRQRAEAEELRNDPAKLAKFLVQASQSDFDPEL